MVVKGQRTRGFVPEHTALLVIDPVNDFLSEGGADWNMTRRTVLKHDVVGHLKEAIEGARQRRIPVLFAPMAYTAEDYENEELQRRSGINRMMFEKKMFLAGSWGADFHPQLRPTTMRSSSSPTRVLTSSRPTCPNISRRWGPRTW